MWYTHLHPTQLSSKHVPFISVSWSWTKHSNFACTGQPLETLPTVHTNISCASACKHNNDCQAFTLNPYRGECSLYADCTLTPSGNFDSYKSAGTQTTKGSGETTKAVEGNTLTTEGATEQSDGTTKPTTEGTTEESGVTKPADGGTTGGSEGAKPTVVETTRGSAGTTLTSDEIMEGSRRTTLAS